MTGYKLLIDGELVEGAMTMDVIDPSNESVLAVAPRASKAQLDAAVASAKSAFPAWSRTPVSARREMLLKLTDAIEADRDAIARLLTQEQGKPLAEAGAEVDYSLFFMRHFATLDLEDYAVDHGDQRRIDVQRRPLGVVAAITPWNFPILIMSSKLPFALLAGNTVVLKPAPTTPLTTLKIGELMADIFPPGVVNIITDLNDLGGHLTSHPDVAKVSFTGSTETGRKVMASASATIKRLTLELGGNDAAIVLPDADPAKIAPALFRSAFGNAGQVCIAVKRVYAHDSIYDELCTELAALAEETIVDSGLAQGATMGPLQNGAQYAKVQEIIADARENGTIISGESKIDRPGYFIRPTIVRDITDGTRLVDEEQFGPVLPVIRYSDVDDAVACANSSALGLGASVWSIDSAKARAVAERLEAGTIWINTHGELSPAIPFAGAKQSGVGVEFAHEGLAEFTQLHVINEAL